MDVNATALEDLLVQANSAILVGESNAAITAITKFAELIFTIAPFTPKDLPNNWQEVLTAWLSGKAIVDLVVGKEAEVLQFIEQGLTYNLPWGMEAVRVRGLAHDDSITDELSLSDFELGLAVAAVETGTLNRSASILMRSGFNSRMAAIKAIEDGSGDFSTVNGLCKWIQSAPVFVLSLDEAWPTPETHGMWKAFVLGLRPAKGKVWKSLKKMVTVKWNGSSAPVSGTPLRIDFSNDAVPLVWNSEHELLGRITTALRPVKNGILRATVAPEPNRIALNYVGPDEFDVS